MNNGELERLVRHFFRRQASVRAVIPGTAGNLYEIYVYSVVCQAAVQAGLSLRLHGGVAGTFSFRCSPGVVSNNFSYFSFHGGSGDVYEIRNGIELRGHSKMRHESDICVLRRPARSSQPAGTYEDIVLAIECKCYTSPARLKAEVRKNLGMVQDWSQSSHASQGSGKQQGCIHCGLGFRSLFVTNVRRDQRQDIQQYLETYDLNPRFGMNPRSGEVDRFRDELAAHFAKL